MATKPKVNSPARAATPPASDDEMSFKDLRVLEFGVENFMRIVAVTIKPDGPMVELTGKNRQGKSSIIKALVSVFAGKGALPSKPIRRGQTESRVWTVLGRDDIPELTIEEVLTLKGDDEVSRKLVVTPADGRPYREPQQLLNRLYDPIAFAPFEFSRKPPKDQLEIVKALVPGVDFDDIAQRRRDLFDDRTQVGRDRDRAAARHQGIYVEPGTPEEEIDVADLVAQMTRATEHNDMLATRRRGREQARETADAKRDEIEQLQAKIATLTREVDDIDAKLAAAEPLPAAIDVGELERTIGDAQSVNEAVRVLKGKNAARQEHNDLGARYVEMTQQIAAIDEEKALAIENANLPVPGLTFGDDGLLLNGLPLDQASGREKLETAVRIGMAMNPDLKLIVAGEGALLDDEGLATLEALAEKHGFLVVIEKVTNGQKVGFVIEDGSLAP